jgi:hypothetical protein
MARDYISELVATKNLKSVVTENIEVGSELLGKIIFGPKNYGLEPAPSPKMNWQISAGLQ